MTVESDHEQRLATLVADAVAKAVREQMTIRCRQCKDSEHHDKAHEFVDRLMLAADKWQDAQWDVKKDVLKWVTRILIMATFIGLFILAHKYGHVPIPTHHE